MTMARNPVSYSPEARRALYLSETRFQAEADESGLNEGKFVFFRLSPRYKLVTVFNTIHLCSQLACPLGLALLMSQTIYLIDIVIGLLIWIITIETHAIFQRSI